MKSLLLVPFLAILFTPNPGPTPNSQRLDRPVHLMKEGPMVVAMSTEMTLLNRRSRFSGAVNAMKYQDCPILSAALLVPNSPEGTTKNASQIQITVEWPRR